MSSDVQVTVIGGGVVGSAAAWRLAARGLRVLLLEQFSPGHDRGASHGTSRIFRHAYGNLHYVALAQQAHRGWRRLQELDDTEVLTLTGAVDHGDPAELRVLADTLSASGVGHAWIDTAAAAARWPGLRFDTAVLHHASAGRLHADRAVVALQRQAAAAGADIRHGAAVLGIERRATAVEVLTSAGSVITDELVVAAGAWTPDLVGDLLPLPELVTTQEQPVHLAPLTGRADDDAWPSFIHHPGGEYHGPGIYGLGSSDGVKAGEHGTGPRVHPDGRIAAPDPAGVDRMREYAETWLPGTDPASAEPISCLYTTTPDHDFVIDRRDRVTVAAGFSGHGFKFGPALGDLVADLVSGTSGPHPLFALDRFHPARAGG